MRRRAFLASGAGALAAAAGCAGLDTGSKALSGATVRTIDAPGSKQGSLSLPTGSVVVLDVFATNCAPCETEMKRLTAARSRLDSSISFVSVTNQVVGGSFTTSDLRRWWTTHDGAWPVGFDAHGTIDRVLGVSALPTLAVVGPGGDVAWRHEGVASVDALVSAVRSETG